MLTKSRAMLINYPLRMPAIHLSYTFRGGLSLPLPLVMLPLCSSLWVRFYFVTSEPGSLAWFRQISSEKPSERHGRGFVTAAQRTRSPAATINFVLSNYVHGRAHTSSTKCYSSSLLSETIDQPGSSYKGTLRKTRIFKRSAMVVHRIWPSHFSVRSSTEYDANR